MILTPSRAVRVFAYPAPADLRKGYDGLYRLVEQGLKTDPMSGDLFLFVNESRKLCKVLVWDGIEELRRLALAIEAQNRLLLEALAKSRREVSHLRGKPSGDIQLTLKMLEELNESSDRRAHVHARRTRSHVCELWR